MFFEKKKYKRLGEILIEKGLITESELQKALKYSKEKGKPIGESLVESGFVTWDEIVHALAEQWGVEPLEKVPTMIPPDVLSKVPKSMIDELRIIPLEVKEDGTLVVVTDISSDLQRIQSSLKFLLGRSPEILIASPVTFDYLYKSFILGTPEEIFYEPGTEEDLEAEDLEALAKEEEENAPIIKLISMIVHRAIEKGASDIHIEPSRNIVRVRYRTDGMLKNVMNYPKIQHNAAVIRVKILSNLDISERRLPQDGKFYLKVAGEQYDFRVSTVPTVHGEKIVMRILKVSSANKQLGDLGFNEYNIRRIERLISEPHGILLVTGPTGSGKSTTLVAMINELKNEAVNIVTAEDPVEYTIDGVTQCQVKPEIGLTFAKYLRTFLRQDPDIIMVGEIRDRETAQLAVEASMTGHLVLSTLHTNDASSAIDRLRNMGIDPRLVSSSLIGVIAQRLVRRINRRCRIRKVPLRPDLASHFSEYFKSSGYEPVEYKVEETDQCADLYKGRIAIGEVLMVDESMKELIASSASIREIQRAAVENGMRPMFIDGLEKVLKGETTVEELLRVVHFPEL